MTSSPKPSSTSDTSLPDAKVDSNAVSNTTVESMGNISSDSTNSTIKPVDPKSAVPVTPPRPLHPMPTNFPELSLPTETRLPRPVLPMAQVSQAPAPLPNPHDIYDGSSTYSPEHVVCVRCGSSNLAQGQIVDYGDKFRNVLFAPRRVSLRWLNSVLAILPFRALVKTNAIACRNCGLVQLTIDPSELRHAERRRD